MFMLTLIFAAVHSGLASFRDQGEKLIGERAFRVLFAGTSLPLAVSTVVSSRPSHSDLCSFFSFLMVFQKGYLSYFVYKFQTKLIDVSLVCGSGILHQPQI